MNNREVAHGWSKTCKNSESAAGHMSRPSGFVMAMGGFPIVNATLDPCGSKGETARPSGPINLALAPGREDNSPC
jgi:hypothetical protein